MPAWPIVARLFSCRPPNINQARSVAATSLGRWIERSIVRSHDPRASNVARAARCFISGRIIRIKITDYAVSSNGSAKKKFLEILFEAREIFRCIRFAFHSPPNRDTGLYVFHGWLIAEFLQRPLKYDAIKSKMKLRHYELYMWRCDILQQGSVPKGTLTFNHFYGKRKDHPVLYVMGAYLCNAYGNSLLK